ncbi:threonine aldolase family protein [Tepidamorphus sp. 3E244]|uniref:threonine aldolase family protein n=1 Tax=Tepidamorphus sp. 3E244 TaxID=3385498 RepID=UPI0038FC13F3
MFFGSDNTAGVSPKIMRALEAANSGYAPAYGNDDLTAKVEEMLAELFECEVAVSLVATGTAANALALSCLTTGFGALVCHAEAHIAVDECNAPEMFSGGAKLVTVPGYAAKLTPDSITQALERVGPRVPHQPRPQAISITQATEAGCVYSLDETRAIADLAKSRGLKLHMDGARFANAVCSLDCTPAEATWKAGVDILSFGATKPGAMAAEAVIAFNPDLREELGYRRKRSGHLVSKHRFVAAQWFGFLDGEHWRELASHANAMAKRLADGFAASGNIRMPMPVEANEVLPIMPAATEKKLKDAGVAFYPWSDYALGIEPPMGEGEVICRFVTSFATTPDDVDRTIAIVSGD